MESMNNESIDVKNEKIGEIILEAAREANLTKVKWIS
jgi:hypothetical protein